MAAILVRRGERFAKVAAATSCGRLVLVKVPSSWRVETLPQGKVRELYLEDLGRMLMRASSLSYLEWQRKGVYNGVDLLYDRGAKFYSPEEVSKM